jgi:hypothetical protein
VRVFFLLLHLFIRRKANKKVEEGPHPTFSRKREKAKRAYVSAYGRRPGSRDASPRCFIRASTLRNWIPGLRRDDESESDLSRDALERVDI